jgi:hypothetical protein
MAFWFLPDHIISGVAIAAKTAVDTAPMGLEKSNEADIQIWFNSSLYMRKQSKYGAGH